MVSATTLSSLIALIYDAALDPRRWPECLEALAAATNAASTTFLSHDFRDHRASISVSVGVDPEAERRYNDYFSTIDPWILGAARRGLLKPGVVHIGEELISHGNLTRTEYYNDLAKPFGISRVLSSVIRQDDVMAISVSALRPDSHEPFREGDRELVAALIPHLQRAMQLHRRFVGLELMKHAVADVLDRLPRAVMLVHEDGTLMCVNRAAERILRRHDGLTSSARGLLATVSAETRTLLALIGGAARASRGHGTAPGGTMRLSRRSTRRPLLVLVTPMRLPSPPSVGLDDHQGMAAVFVSDPDDTIQADSQMLKEMWGLTATEATIATLFSGGLRIREIADRLSIGRNTVRWHFKHVLAKTQTRSQSELVRLVMTGPALLRH